MRACEVPEVALDERESGLGGIGGFGRHGTEVYAVDVGRGGKVRGEVAGYDTGAAADFEDGAWVGDGSVYDAAFY